jgi:hypothetical protein
MRRLFSLVIAAMTADQSELSTASLGTFPGGAPKAGVIRLL